MKRQQRNNIAVRAGGDDFEYLKDEVARRLIDRLEDIDREFPFALDLGCGSGHIYKNLSEDDGLGGVTKLIQCDSAGEESIYCCMTFENANASAHPKSFSEKLLLRDFKREEDANSSTACTFSEMLLLALASILIAVEW